MEKVNCTGSGNGVYIEYAPSHTESESAVAFSNSDPEILFAFGPRYAGSPPRSRHKGVVRGGEEIQLEKRPSIEATEGGVEGPERAEDDF